MVILASLSSAVPAYPQRPRFPSGQSTPVRPNTAAPPGSARDVPQTNLAPVGPPPPAGPGAPAGAGTAGSTLFDPYATGGSNGSNPAAPPSLAPGPSGNYPGGGLLGGLFSTPAGAPMSPGAAPPSFSPPPPGAPSGYPSSVYPSESPSSLFPGGLAPGGSFVGFMPDLHAHRLLQGPRLRHGYIADSGDGADDLSINDTDVSVAFAFPRFLYSTQPLYVVPSFGLHLWDGPRSTGGPRSADLPSAVYDGFLDFGWQSDPNQIFGLELGTRVGAFTDFDTFNSDSIRVMGKALVSFRLTPTSTLKGGAYYLDRNDIQLIPAGGLLWQPDPMTRFDIFFPEPKLAHYWRTVGTHDVWWYLAGDYGGGSWTIERADETEDSVDLNDLRVMFGLEWGRSDLLRTGRRSGFLEAGYVFAREVEYRRSPEDDFEPDNAFMVRAGIGY